MGNKESHQFYIKLRYMIFLKAIGLYLVRNVLYILAIKSEYWKFEYFTIFLYRTLLPVMISMSYNCSQPSNHFYPPPLSISLPISDNFFPPHTILSLYIFFLHTQFYHCTDFFFTYNPFTVQIFSSSSFQNLCQYSCAFNDSFQGIQL